MANVQGSGDLSVFTESASSLLAVIKGVTFEMSPELADTSAITQVGHRKQKVKNSCSIKTGLMSTLSGDSGMVASNLAIGAFTIGGTSYLSYLQGGSFKGTYDVREVSGPADAFAWPQIFGKDYSAEVDLRIPLTGSPNILRNISANVLDADLVDQDLIGVAFSITIDGVAITVPMVIKNVSVKFQDHQEQVVTLSLEGHATAGAAYPTAPTGTTTLLERAFNLYNTAIAMVLTTFAASDGVSYGGNFIFSDFGFSFNNSEIIMIDYGFISRGTITGTNN